MTSPTTIDSMFSPASLAIGYGTSLLSIPVPQVDTSVLLPPIVLPTSRYHVTLTSAEYVFSSPLASHHALSISLCSLRTKGNLVILAVYIDDILLIGSDDTGIHGSKTYLNQNCRICDLGSPKYFFDFDFAHQDEKLTLTQ